MSKVLTYIGALFVTLFIVGLWLDMRDSKKAEDKEQQERIEFLKNY